MCWELIVLRMAQIYTHYTHTQRIGEELLPLSRRPEKQSALNSSISIQGIFCACKIQEEIADVCGFYYCLSFYFSSLDFALL